MLADPTPGRAARAPIPPPADGAAEEGARAALYALLARLWLAPPGPAELAALGRDAATGATPLAGALEDAALALVRVASALPEDVVADEFAALFEGVAAPLVDPYASRYLAGAPMQQPLAALRGELAALGLARVAGARVPEDHLGALCEAMRLLAGGAPGYPARPLAAQRAFFARHIEPWVERCLDDVMRAAPARFYARVAELTRAFVEVEREAFELLEEETG